MSRSACQAFERALMVERVIKRAMEFPNQAALDAYMNEHPVANPQNHSVKDHSRGTERSDHPNVVEYAAQTMIKGKSPAAAAKDTVKKHHGAENMFFGPGPSHIDAKKLEDQLWGRLVDIVVKGMSHMKEGMGHFALDGTMDQFKQKPSVRAELKKRVIKQLGKDPFVNDK